MKKKYISKKNWMLFDAILKNNRDILLRLKNEFSTKVSMQAQLKKN